MPDCFISYSNPDKDFAVFVQHELARHKVSTFLASTSLKPNERWSPTILANLHASNWVIVMASKAASTSAFVNQEIGVALANSKKLVPIVWDMSPKELPGWLADFQALDLRDSTVGQLKQEVATIADRIHQEKTKGWLILGGFFAALLYFGGD